jgi:hypothetical protein
MHKIQHTITWKYMPLYEKIAHLNTCIGKSNDPSNPYLNKLLSRDIIVKNCADLRLPIIHKVFDTVSEFITEDIRNNRILKLTHGSGNVLILEESMKLYEVHNRLLEWKNKYPMSKFYIEEAIYDFYTKDIGNAYTLQVKCIHGEPFAVDVKYKSMFKSYDPRWRELPLFIESIRRLPNRVEKPPVLDKILQYAKALAKSFEFIRIDFFMDVDRGIYFNEFDFFPNGGHMFYTPKCEKDFGKLWN